VVFVVGAELVAAEVARGHAGGCGLVAMKQATIYFIAEYL